MVDQMNELARRSPRSRRSIGTISNKENLLFENGRTIRKSRCNSLGNTENGLGSPIKLSRNTVKSPTKTRRKSSTTTFGSPSKLKTNSQLSSPKATKKSILKLSTDATLNLTQLFMIDEDTTQRLNHNEDHTRTRKSLDRRVSFAKDVHLRYFEKDDEWKADTPNKITPEDFMSFSSPDSMDPTLRQNTAYNALSLKTLLEQNDIHSPPSTIHPEQVNPTPVRRLSGTSDNDDSLIIDQDEILGSFHDPILPPAPQDIQPSPFSQNLGIDNSADLSSDTEDMDLDSNMDLDVEQASENINIMADLVDSLDHRRQSVSSIGEEGIENGNTMDITTVVGGIKEVNSSRRQSARRSLEGNIRRLSLRSLGSDNMEEDETMDITGVVGGIRDIARLRRHSMQSVESDHEGDQGATMDITTIIGGIKEISSERQQNVPTGFSTITVEGEEVDDNSDADSRMEMTTVVGGIREEVDEGSPVRRQSMPRIPIADLNRNLDEMFGLNSSPIKQTPLEALNTKSDLNKNNEEIPIESLISNKSSHENEVFPYEEQQDFENEEKWNEESEKDIKEVPSSFPIITLSEFLQTIGISFMDNLATTKRRETLILPTTTSKPILKDFVIAAAITMPMLDLYQFSCRELKKYIAAGKEVVQVLEADTLEANPLLFREYLEASNDEREAMDMEFRLIKANSRLTAKGNWYDWRAKLLPPVKSALDSNLQQLHRDNQYIDQFADKMQGILPVIEKEHARLKEQLQSAKAKQNAQLEVQDEETLGSLQEVIEEQASLLEEYQTDYSIQEEEFQSTHRKWRELRNERENLISAITSAQKAYQDYKYFSVQDLVKFRKEFERVCKIYLWSPIRLSPDEIEMVHAAKLKVGIKLKDKEKIHLSLQQNDEGPFSCLDKLFLQILQTTVASQLELSANAQDFIRQAVRIASTFWHNVEQIISELKAIQMHFPIYITTDMEEAAFNVKVVMVLPSCKAKLHLNVVVDAQEAVKVYPILGDGAMDLLVDVAYGNVNELDVTRIFKNRLSRRKRLSYRSLYEACLDVWRQYGT